MNLETKITIYKFTPQVFTLTLRNSFIFALNDSEAAFVEGQCKKSPANLNDLRDPRINRT